MTDTRQRTAASGQHVTTGPQPKVPLVLDLAEVGSRSLALVGGKGANLGELASIPRIAVPEGFCVTTAAYEQLVAAGPGFLQLLGRLGRLDPNDHDRLGQAAADLRALIAGTVIPDGLRDQIARRLAQFDPSDTFTVRSSATAEDLPSASFAGQQDTYLNVAGVDAVLDGIRRCWASLFTDRAIRYRISHGVDHAGVRLAVVVQRMVDPDAAGIMFTADPVTSNRRVVSINAGFGLGEGLVSGLVEPDTYTVRDQTITSRRIGTQAFAVRQRPGGGTRREQLYPGRQTRQVLTDAQILRMAALGRRIERHFGCPQDIEWCLVGSEIFVVQSRPVTTLYPVPEGDGRMRVYLSYGHRQMMTDAFKPLGTSFFALLDQWLGRPAMAVAGSRFYKDISHELASPLARRIMLSSLGLVDTLMQSALQNVLKRPDLVRALPRGRTSVMSFGRGGVVPMATQFLALRRRNDPDVVPQLIAANEQSVARLRRDIAGRSGDDLFTFIEKDHRELTDLMFEPRSVAAAYLGIATARWLDKHLEAWLGEKNTADALAQAAPHNVVAEMGLDLLDVADVVREHPAVRDYLQHPSQSSFLSDLAGLEGGSEVAANLRVYLNRYGMHCSGDIDITRTRWSEDPTALAPMLLANATNFPPGAHQARIRQGRLQAERTAADLLARLRSQRGGARKARQVERQIGVLRNFIGYREYSKHALLQRYAIYKEALLGEAQRLLDDGLVADRDDVFFLSLAEFRSAVRTHQVDLDLVSRRRAAFQTDATLNPPRVITSEGEVFDGTYDTAHRPPGALAGSPVSAGVVEGRARIVRDLERTRIDQGDVLVTGFIDPSWPPLLVTAAAVVMEIGGSMTHGAVIAREYGLPAVAGVANATSRIRDGQQIRVNGSEGYVELLSPGS
jgi:phosphoenolpyruvate synthase/pyruvate phosphate dikinase